MIILAFILGLVIAGAVGVYFVMKALEGVRFR